MARTESDADGRLLHALPSDLDEGVYRLRFETEAYFSAKQVPTLYPHVDILVRVEADEHVHVALLLGPFGYTTYRGS